MRKHKCPYCGVDREAPLSVLAHPRDIYTVSCECEKQYLYMYDAGRAWKLEDDECAQ
jgi:hypothetical protein